MADVLVTPSSGVLSFSGAIPERSEVLEVGTAAVTVSPQGVTIARTVQGVGFANLSYVGTPVRVEYATATGIAGSSHIGVATGAYSYGLVTGIAPTGGLGAHLSYTIGVAVAAHFAVRIKLTPRFGTGKGAGAFDGVGVLSQINVGQPSGIHRAPATGVSPTSGVGSLSVSVRGEATGVYVPAQVGTGTIVSSYAARGVRGGVRIGVPFVGGLSIFPQTYQSGWLT